MVLRVGDGPGQCLGLGGQPGRAVRVAHPGGRAGQLGQRPSQVVVLGDGAGQGLGAVRVVGLRGQVGQVGERPLLEVRVGDGAGQGLGAVQVPGLRGRAGQRVERLPPVVGVGDGLGQRLSIGGQPGRAVLVAGLGGRRLQLGQRPHLVERLGDAPGHGLGPVWVPGLRGRRRHVIERPRPGIGLGDGASQSFAMIETTQPRPYAGQGEREALVTERHGVPVDGQLQQSLQIGLVLARDKPLCGRDLGLGGIVAPGRPQQERVPARVAGQRRQPDGVAGGDEQVRVVPYGVARRGVWPALTGVGGDPLVDFLRPPPLRILHATTPIASYYRHLNGGSPAAADTAKSRRRNVSIDVAAVRVGDESRR